MYFCAGGGGSDGWGLGWSGKGAAMGEAWRGCGNPVLETQEMGLSDGRLEVV